jgi:hypothetical protein
LGLIDIIINCGDHVDDVAPYLINMKLMDQFLPTLEVSLDPYFESRTTWDQLRLQILSVCMEKIVFPNLKNELTREMIKLGREVIIEESANKFESLLKEGKFWEIIYKKEELKGLKKKMTYFMN